MSGFNENLLTDAAGTFFGGDYLRDFTHASKTFRTNSYAYAPKFKFLFHVYFDINTAAYSQNVGTGQNFGLAVKTVQLPQFSFDTHTMNQYNRKRLIQSKIKYNPINIAFHDDNGNIVRNMWKAYYNYYYSDGTKPKVVLGGSPRGGQTVGGTILNLFNAEGNSLADYDTRTQYVPSITGNDNWGFSGESGSDKKVPFFKNITVFGMNQHNFVAYTLVNPIITSFNHDTYSYADDAGTMEHTMSVDYETVVYNEGALDGRAPSNIVTGFGLEDNYDRTLSPISRPGSQSSILGQGGLVDGVGGAITAFSEGRYKDAIQAAGTTYNTFKNANLKTIAKNEVISGIQNAVQQTPNRNLNIVTPVFGASPTNLGTAGSPTTGAQSSPVQIGPNQNAGKQN